MSTVPTPIVLTTGHANADTVGAAFARGANDARLMGAFECTMLRDEVQPDFLPIFYGILRGTQDVIANRRRLGLPWLYLDRGYFGATQGMDLAGTFRVCLSDVNWGPEDLPPPRAEWRWRQPAFTGWSAATERLVVVARPNPHSAEFLGVEPDAWVADVCARVREHTNRPIIITAKGDGYGPATLRRAHALVTLQSNLACDALMMGVPAFVLGRHPLAGLGNTDVAYVENPTRKSRDDVWDLAARMCSAQFTLAEMRRGDAWEWARGLLESAKLKEIAA